MQTEAASDDFSAWSTWEAEFRPYPAVIDGMGFDKILDMIADQVVEPGGPLYARWGDVHLAGHFDRVIVLTVDEPVADPGEFQPKQMGAYQDDVAFLLLGMGLEGYLTVARCSNIARSSRPDGEE